MKISTIVCYILCYTCMFFIFTAVVISVGEGASDGWYKCDAKPSNKFKDCTDIDCFKDWLEHHTINYWEVLNRSFRGKESFVLNYNKNKELVGDSGYTKTYVITVYLTLTLSMCLFFFIYSIDSKIRNNRNNILEESRGEEPTIEDEYQEETESMLDNRLNMFIHDSSNSCSVCLEEYDDGIKLASLKCGHKYHAVCINKWIKEHEKCPLCNQQDIV